MKLVRGQSLADAAGRAGDERQRRSHRPARGVSVTCNGPFRSSRWVAWR
jgi:hypothetical protein